MTRPNIAQRDENSVPSLLAVSSADGETPVVVWADPVTHRLLIQLVGTAGLTPLTFTGAVNGSNISFTTSEKPTYVVSDGAWYQATDNNGVTQWTWNGVDTVTMVIPPQSAIWGFK